MKIPCHIYPLAAIVSDTGIYDSGFNFCLWPGVKKQTTYVVIIHSYTGRDYQPGGHDFSVFKLHCNGFLSGPHG